MSAAQTHIKRFDTHLFGPFNPPQIVRICRGIYDRTPQIHRLRCCSSCLLSSRCRTTNCAARRAAYRAVRQQVTYICAGVTFACGTTAALRYRPGIKFVFFGEQPHFAAPSENISVLCIAQRQHTVKKIHPAINSLKDVQRCADAH